LSTVTTVLQLYQLIILDFTSKRRYNINIVSRERADMATARDIEEIIGVSSNTIETWSRGSDSKALLSKFLKSFSKEYLQEKVGVILEQEHIEKTSLKRLIEKISDYPDKLFSNESLELVYSSHLREAFSDHFQRGPDLLLFDKNTGLAIIVHITSLMPSRLNLVKKIQRDTVFSLEAMIELSNIAPNNIQEIEYVVISNSKVPNNVDFKYIPDTPKYLDSIIFKDSKITRDDLEKALNKTQLKGIKINKVASELYNNKKLIIV
jgi:hypothetical protein